MQNQEAPVYNEDVAVRKTKGTWGGWRPGAGRKPVLKDAVSFTGDVERDDMDALEAIAEEKGISVAALVRQAIRAFLKRRRK